MQRTQPRTTRDRAVGGGREGRGKASEQFQRSTFLRRSAAPLTELSIERAGRAPLTHVPFIRLTREQAGPGDSG